MILNNLQKKTTPNSKDNEKVSRKILIIVPTSAKRNGTCTQKSTYGNLPKNARSLRQWTAEKMTFFKRIHLIALTTILKIILLKKVLENIHEDISVTFDNSFNKNSTDDNVSDYDNPGLWLLCYARVFSFEVLISGSVC